MLVRWSLAAISGTIPPYWVKFVFWLITTFDKISFFELTIATAVSSQLVSIPIIIL